MLVILLTSAAERILLNKPLSRIEDKHLVNALLDLCARFEDNAERTKGAVVTDTSADILREALLSGLRIGADWITGATEGAYDAIQDERMMQARVVEDEMPELITRMYMCEHFGPKTTGTKKRIKLGVTT
jgi:hypothetical protein